jgi:hypothetical protein
MRLAIETIAYHEERFISRFIQHYQDKVETILVLHSTKPWNGEDEPYDRTANIARSLGAEVVDFDWTNETDQRNAGIDILSDYDWVLVLDPDEFISDRDWDKMVDLLEVAEAPAYVVQHQRVFWKDKEVFPHSDYQQIIAVRPDVRFVENRVINSLYGELPIDLLHFSWARTDEEVLRKITHYAHAKELIPNWYEDVWLSNKTQNLHPKSPETLAALVTATLPAEIEGLELWPSA